MCRKRDGRRWYFCERNAATALSQTLIIFLFILSVILIATGQATIVYWLPGVRRRRSRSLQSHFPPPTYAPQVVYRRGRLEIPRVGLRNSLARRNVPQKQQRTHFVNCSVESVDKTLARLFYVKSRIDSGHRKNRRSIVECIPHCGIIGVPGGRISFGKKMKFLTGITDLFCP